VDHRSGTYPAAPGVSPQLCGLRHTEVFIQDIRDLEKDADAEDAKGSDSSQDEEETKDGGNAGTDAPA
jgi:hypothetical protein